MTALTELFTVSNRQARRLPDSAYAAYFRALNAVQVRRGFDKVVLEKTATGWEAFEPSTQRRVVLTHRGHIVRYAIGISNRMRNLADSYGVTRVIRPGDVVVESGAWAGEIGMLCTEAGCQYYAFEPDPVAFAALQKNVAQGVLTNAALWSEDAELEMYLATAFGDSGVFATPNTTGEYTKVKAFALDNFAADHGIDHVRLFKLEAEGAEPEVLEGATKTLEHTDYVAIDAGPERGGQTTLVECANILQQAGFAMSTFSHRRFHVMFRNERLDPSDQPQHL